MKARLKNTKDSWEGQIVGFVAIKDEPYAIINIGNRLIYEHINKIIIA